MNTSEETAGQLRRCPKCSNPMERVLYRLVQVDRCVNCRGLWFDSLEVDWLKAEDGSEVIDQGDPKIGEQHNLQRRIQCPICNLPMIKMVDPKQPQIWFEKCGFCQGIYFDAGEFKDFKDYSIKDWIDSWDAPERKH